MPLTEKKCSNIKASGERQWLPDGGGLYFLVNAKGAKSWECDFTRKGNRARYNYGRYPDISLSDARTFHGIALELAEQGRPLDALLDNARVRSLILGGKKLREIETTLSEEAAQQAKATRMTFADAATAYKTDYVDHNWKNADKQFAPVRNHLLPKLGTLPIEDITPALLRELFYDIREHRGDQIALHVRGWCKRIFDYAAEQDWCTSNPAQIVKAKRIGTHGKRERWLKTSELKAYLIALYQTRNYHRYKLALHLLLMLAVRKGELIGANWSEFDLGAGEWLIPSERMKSEKEHLVMLPRQAVKMLHELQQLGRGSPCVFPMLNDSNSPMNVNSLDRTHRATVQLADIQDYVIHDHRHTASTHLREQGYFPEVVETALSHAIPGMSGRYSHATYRQQRIEMMQSWADLLDELMAQTV